MDVTISPELFKALQKAGAKSPVFKEQGYWRTRTIDTKHLSTADIKVLQKVCALPGFADDLDAKRNLRKLRALAEIGDTIDEHTPVKRIDLLADVLTQAIREVPRRWIFMQEWGGLVPYFVTSIKYKAAERHRGGGYTPAHVTLTGAAIARGKVTTKSMTFYQGDLPATPVALLDTHDALLATQALLDTYDQEDKLYRIECERTGEQYVATGEGTLTSERDEQDEDGHRRWWSRDDIAFEREGQPSKVVMDDAIGRGDSSPVANTQFWAKGSASDDEDEPEDDDPEAGQVLLPTHPLVRVFSLDKHQFAVTHLANLKRYEYDATVIDKLVLPPGTKKLIDALTGSAIERMSDIIRGKAQGVIILCSGLPGTGKTLTAEVYSEAAQRPLYVVQCSQLGTDEVKLEKRLGQVLERATRWRAILLIDEADVYIHDRGDDIAQNAIVGVFLRLLEYYNGILFLTTNRATVIDDAIMSRMTAHVRYEIPRDEDRERLWQILLKQYGLRASADLVAAAIKRFPRVSGRSIRQLVRLGLFMAKAEGKGLTLGHLVNAAQFHDIEDAK